MKAYSIFLVILMGVNFALMAYSKMERRIVIVFSVLSYGVFVFAKDLLLSSKNPFLLYILALMILTLFLYKKCGREIFKTAYFVLPWIILSRLCGLPDNPEFGEKDFVILVTSAFNATFLLWACFLLFHQKIYQKIVFWIMSACLAFLFSCFNGIGGEAICIILLPFYPIQIILALAFYPLSYAFFYCGELLLFLILCYEVFFRDPKGSHAEGPQDQGCQAPSQESNTPSHSSQSHPPRES